MSDWNEDLEKTFKQFEVSCRVGMLCRLNRDFEEDAINFHFQHIKGTDRQYVLQDARQKCANNINTWRCRAMDKHEVSVSQIAISLLQTLIQHRIISKNFARGQRFWMERKTLLESKHILQNNTPWIRS